MYVRTSRRTRTGRLGVGMIDDGRERERERETRRNKRGWVFGGVTLLNDVMENTKRDVVLRRRPRFVGAGSDDVVAVAFVHDSPPSAPSNPAHHLIPFRKLFSLIAALLFARNARVRLSRASNASRAPWTVCSGFAGRSTLCSNTGTLGIRLSGLAAACFRRRLASARRSFFDFADGPRHMCQRLRASNSPRTVEMSLTV